MTITIIREIDIDIDAIMQGVEYDNLDDSIRWAVQTYIDEMDDEDFFLIDEEAKEQIIKEVKARYK